MTKLDEITHSIAYCEYTKAEVKLRKLRAQLGVNTDSKLYNLFTQAINEAQQHHILGCLRILTSIQAIIQK